MGWESTGNSAGAGKIIQKSTSPAPAGRTPGIPGIPRISGVPAEWEEGAAVRPQVMGMIQTFGIWERTKPSGFGSRERTKPSGFRTGPKLQDSGTGNNPNLQDLRAGNDPNLWDLRPGNDPNLQDLGIGNDPNLWDLGSRKKPSGSEHGFGFVLFPLFPLPHPKVIPVRSALPAPSPGVLPSRTSAGCSRTFLISQMLPKLILESAGAGEGERPWRWSLGDAGMLRECCGNAAGSAGAALAGRG